VEPDYKSLEATIRELVERTAEVAGGMRMLFVTNLRSKGELQDLGPDGVLNSAQWYTRREADQMVRSFQELGLTVEPYFSELEFLVDLAEESESDPRDRIVYSTAEGGSGPGRRALLPALCSLLGLPILNCGAHASSLVRHKFHAYSILRQRGIRMPDTWQLERDGWVGGARPEPGTRVILKPTYESMGIGVQEDSVAVVDDGFDAFAAHRVSQFGQPAIIQEFVTGEEVGVPVARIGTTHALPPIAQRRRNGESYGGAPKTFRDEHVEHDLSHQPYVVPAIEIEALRTAAVSTFDALEMRGVGRIDFRIDQDGRAWVFDTNGEPPPMSPTCWSMAMDQLGFSFSDMLAFWVGICLFDYGLLTNRPKTTARSTESGERSRPMHGQPGAAPNR
jgi:D-alanine-D-alanine ligase